MTAGWMAYDKTVELQNGKSADWQGGNLAKSQNSSQIDIRNHWSCIKLLKTWRKHEAEGDESITILSKPKQTKIGISTPFWKILSQIND